MSKRQMYLVLVLGFLLIGPISLITADVSEAQDAANPKGDLWGGNNGDAIFLKWLAEPSATEYVVYRGTSLTGPWAELFRDENIDVGGMREDVTSDAKVMDLCYRVEGINGTGQVIRNYEPMCVPKFVE